MRSSHSTRRKFHVPVVGTGGITFDFPSQPSNAFTLSMAASDNLHIPTDESIHAYAERKGVKTDQQREVERQTNGEEEYVPSKGELAAQLLIEKIADSDEEDHLAKKRKGSTSCFFFNLFNWGLNTLVLSSVSSAHTSSSGRGAAVCYPD